MHDIERVSKSFGLLVSPLVVGSGVIWGQSGPVHEEDEGGVLGDDFAAAEHPEGHRDDGGGEQH